jgi:DHA1 family bicyclomycin/chloramphenicol resistance-like MFS transporter
MACTGSKIRGNTQSKWSILLPVQKKPLLILILGLMTALSPFSIDMYLPAFGDIAKDFGTTVLKESLSL